MQEKGFKLRPDLWVLAVVLFLGAVASLSLADDAFDEDYLDCPSGIRLDAVSGLAIDRTDDGDELRVSWEALDTVALVSRLGPNGYLAKFTVIVENGGVQSMNVALGETTLLVEGIEFTKELTVSVAITQGDYLISDIAEAEFTSGMPAPKFSTTLRVEDGTVSEDKTLANTNFYYLGFNDLFDNWYVVSSSPEIITRPNTPKFRVGLAHGLGTDKTKAKDAGFSNYRITIEDPNGDHIGYQAKTVDAEKTYAGPIYFGNVAANAVKNEAGFPRGGKFTNVRLSTRLENGPASPYYGTVHASATPLGVPGLSFGNAGFGEPAGLVNAVYAVPPVEYFDFPFDVFEVDGNHTIKAWAENEDGDRISSTASITLSTQEGESKFASRFAGYAADTRSWDAADPSTQNTILQLYGFSIKDE